VARANLNGGAKVSEALDELPPLLEAFAELDEFIAAAAERPSSKGYIVLKNAPAPAESAKAGGTDGGPTELCVRGGGVGRPAGRALTHECDDEAVAANPVQLRGRLAVCAGAPQRPPAQGDAVV